MSSGSRPVLQIGAWLPLPRPHHSNQGPLVGGGFNGGGIAGGGTRVPAALGNFSHLGHETLTCYLRVDAW